MDELNRTGHRQRAKEQFINSGFETTPDHHLLELLLFYAIPRRDVKPIAYDLINHFGSLEAVMNASVDELTQVNGIGENAAILINLVNSINNKVNYNKIENSNNLCNAIFAKQYARKYLGNSPVEKFLLISIDNSGRVIRHHILSEGSANHISVDTYKLVECAMIDKASSIIIAHNHPNGSEIPSPEDVNLTINLNNLLRNLHLLLADHIIVGSQSEFSMKSSLEFSEYFDKPKNSY